MIYDWLKALHDGTGPLGPAGPVVLGLIRVLLFVVPLLILVPGLIWWERRLLSWMQDRIGPNRTGTITFPENFPLAALRGKKVRTFGLLQPIADGVKLFFKEDATPSAVDKLVYFTAPAVALFPAFALGGTLPIASLHYPFDPNPLSGIFQYLTPVANVDIGILYVLAVSSLGVYGVVLAGYSSNNKYSLMGGLRASAQLISYELAMAVSLACVVMASGSMRISDIVAFQEGPLWGFLKGFQNWAVFTPFGFVSAVIFVICMIAETNRAPFDLPEAENELIAGYHTEYSSMKFAVFFMGEYAAMFVFSGIFAAVFLGGANLMPFRWEELAAAYPQMAGLFKGLAYANYWLGPVAFLAKQVAGITFFIWLRATLPRLRYDQLMNLGWRSLLPLGVANFIVVGLWVVCTQLYGPVGGWASLIAAFVVLFVLYTNIVGMAKSTTPGIQKREVKLVDPAPRAVKMVDPNKVS